MDQFSAADLDENRMISEMSMQSTAWTVYQSLGQFFAGTPQFLQAMQQALQHEPPHMAPAQAAVEHIIIQIIKGL
jgi:hypothetical protein